MNANPLQRDCFASGEWPRAAHCVAELWASRETGQALHATQPGLPFFVGHKPGSLKALPLGLSYGMAKRYLIPLGRCLFSFFVPLAK